MTYPEFLYTASDAAVTATITRAGGEPDLVRTSGTEVHYLATGDTTGGLFGLYRWSMGPGPGGADAHFHRTMAESFYILTGTVEVYDGMEWADAEAGDFFHVPPGGTHGFRNESGAPASMLIHFAPGAPREQYFEGLDHLEAMSAEEQIDFFLAHDNNFLT
ncbi:MAG: cupin domain-containing protein [Acidimicrobiia bacterium]